MPITSSPLYDFVLIVILIIIGFAVAFKAGKAWGYVLIVVAAVWAFQIVRSWGLW